MVIVNPGNRTVDTLLALKTAGLIAASAAVATILDLGSGEWEGELVLDVTALEIATGDEGYDLVLQGSPDAAFGTAGNIQDLMDLHLGADGTKRTDSDKDDVIGRYILPMTNRLIDTVYRYVRMYTVVVGTIATGINYTARLTKRHT